MVDETLRGGDVGMKTQEVDGSHLVRALEQQAGHAAGEASQEDIDRLMSEEDVEIDEVDRTREIDAREFRGRLQKSSQV